MEIDFDALAAEETEDGGQSVEEILRARRMNELLLRAIEALSKPQPLPPITVAAPEQKAPQIVVQQPKAKSVAWTFEFERNEDGTIKRIHATPKE